MYGVSTTVTGNDLRADDVVRLADGVFLIGDTRFEHMIDGALKYFCHLRYGDDTFSDQPQLRRFAPDEPVELLERPVGRPLQNMSTRERGERTND